MRAGCAALLASLGIVGCIGTNPRWDPSGDTDDSAASSNDEGVADTSSDGLTEGEDATSASDAAESSWTSTGDSSSGEMASADGGPVCNDGEMVCEGECKNTSSDRKACGAACLDCTKVLDSKDAVCENGECRLDNSGPGGSDDDD